MTVLDGLLQGIIQGLTEFLPISSSGHLSLYQYFTGNSGESSLLFTLMLHLGTLAAVITAYYEDLWAMMKEVGRIVKEIYAGEFSWETENSARKMLYMLAVACLPMLLVLLFRSFVEKVSGDRDIVFEGVCFLVTAGLLFLATSMKPGKAGLRRMKPKHAIIIGVMQGIASFPGISRSGSTLSAGMVLGFERGFMVKFSFLLGIPAILGGAIFEIGDAVKQKAEVNALALVVGIITAAVVGYFAIKLVKYLVVSNKLRVFAWYTLVLGILVIIIGIFGHITGSAGEGPADPATPTSITEPAGTPVTDDPAAPAGTPTDAEEVQPGVAAALDSIVYVVKNVMAGG